MATIGQIADEADRFFDKLIGSDDECPCWLNEADWKQLKMIRDQWA